MKTKAKETGIPVVYVNDNFGKWRSDLNQIVFHCVEDDVRGEPFVKLVLPDKDDYFVLKPKHSGFYCTSLELLLEHVGSRSLILAGIAGNNCVLFTANDAYMRDFKLFVPSDCVVSETTDENDYALKQMEKVLKADIRKSSELNFRSSPRWKDRTQRAKLRNCTFIFPHPIDILIAKLHRLDDKDLRAFEIVRAKTGHPTEEEFPHLRPFYAGPAGTSACGPAWPTVVPRNPPDWRDHRSA